MTDELLSERAAARYLGIPHAQLRRLRHEGVIAAARVTLRDADYHLSDVHAFAVTHGFATDYDFGGERVTVIYDEGAPMRASLIGGVVW